HGESPRGRWRNRRSGSSRQPNPRAVLRGPRRRHEGNRADFARRQPDITMSRTGETRPTGETRTVVAVTRGVAGMSRFFDVRMRGFRDRAEVADVLALLDGRTRPLPGEPVALAQLAGRV